MINLIEKPNYICAIHKTPIDVIVQDNGDWLARCYECAPVIPPPSSEGWEKEYEERFGNDGYLVAIDMKNWISKLLLHREKELTLKGSRRRIIEQIRAEVKKELVEKIAGMRQKVKRWNNKVLAENVVIVEAEAYNKALGDILKLL